MVCILFCGPRVIFMHCDVSYYFLKSAGRESNKTDCDWRSLPADYFSFPAKGYLFLTKGH